MIASAKYPQQAEAAKKMGADFVVSVEPGHLEEKCFELTNGIGVDIVVETIGGTSAVLWYKPLNALRIQVR